MYFVHRYGLKIIINTNPRGEKGLFTCAVGPFETEAQAQSWVDRHECLRTPTATVADIRVKQKGVEK